MIPFLNKYTKIILVLTSVLFLSGKFGWSQSSAVSGSEKFSSFSFGEDFTSNNNLNGRVSTLNKQPVLSSMVSYYHKLGFDATLVFSNVWNSDQTNTKASQETTLSLGYDYDITEWLNASVSYNHYWYSKNSNSIQSDYTDLLSSCVYTEVDWWVSNIMAGYYSGRANEFFVNVETGVDFTFEDVFKEGNLLSIQPMISAYAGNINFYNEEAYRNYYFLYIFAQEYPNVTVNDMLIQIQEPDNQIERSLRNKLETRPRLKKRVDSLPSDLVIASMFEEQNSFNLSNIGFILPVFYSWGDFMVNLGLSAYKPLNQPSYNQNSWVMYSNVGLAYFISW
ncbi:hypothetical protein E9993_03770 [Labilibacter sediminis]|nr:hypothetical protein E9993_03770 [Labilibacter sediminis]